MKTLVHFGAGNIGRGFIAPLFTASGWRVIFIDVNQELVAELQTGSFDIVEVTSDSRSTVTVSPVDAIDGRDSERGGGRDCAGGSAQHGGWPWRAQTHWRADRSWSPTTLAHWSAGSRCFSVRERSAGNRPPT